MYEMFHIPGAHYHYWAGLVKDGPVEEGEF